MTKFEPGLFGADPSNAWRTLPILSLGVAFLSFFAGALAGMGAIEALKAGGIYPRTEWANVVISTTLVFGSSIAALLMWVRLFERKSLVYVGLATGGTGKALRGIGAGGGFVAVVVWVMWLAGASRFVQPGALFLPTLATVAPALLLILTFVVQGSFEEIAMRGWVMPVFAARYGPAAGVMVSTVLFTLGHAVNVAISPELLLGLLNVFLAGLFLALYALGEGSLWGPCGWHAAWNWTLGQGFGHDVSGAGTDAPPFFAAMASEAASPWWLTGASFGPEASLVTTAILLCGIAYWGIQLKKGGAAHATVAQGAA